MNNLEYFNLAFPYILLIVIGCITPYFTRKNFVFGVNIPKELYYDKEIIKIRKNYLLNFSISSTVLFIIVMFYIKNVNIAVGGMFFEIALMFMSYLRAHSQVVALKAEREWNKDKKEVAVVDIDFRKKPVLVSSAWFLIPIVILVITMLVGVYIYPELPYKIPMHMDFRGNVDSYAKKSYVSVFLLNIMQLFIILLMYGAYKAIGIAKQQIDPSDPEISTEKNRIFRRLWSGFIIFLTIIVNILFMVSSFFIWGIIKNPSVVNIAVFTFTAVTFIVTIVLTVKTGQGGERIKIKTNDEKTNSINRDDDKHWKLGLFYYNPDDPAIFVEKRFGIGWTVNLARPSVWVGIVIFALILGAIISIPLK